MAKPMYLLQINPCSKRSANSDKILLQQRAITLKILNNIFMVLVRCNSPHKFRDDLDMQRTGTRRTIIKDGHIIIICVKFGQNPVSR